MFRSEVFGRGLRDHDSILETEAVLWHDRHVQIASDRQHPTLREIVIRQQLTLFYLISRLDQRVTVQERTLVERYTECSSSEGCGDLSRSSQSSFVNGCFYYLDRGLIARRLYIRSITMESYSPATDSVYSCDERSVDSKSSSVGSEALFSYFSRSIFIVLEYSGVTSLAK